jgi:hypothetical protein
MRAEISCPHCDEPVVTSELICSQCGKRVRYKTSKEAYSLTGLGLFDLIPGIRDLPYIIRLILMVVVVAGVILLLMGRLYG